MSNLTLQPGVRAPAFQGRAMNTMQDVSLEQLLQHRVVLIFLPTRPSPELIKQLAKFQEHAPAFEEKNVALVAISDATDDALAQLTSIRFPLLGDSTRTLCRQYRVLSDDQRVLPTVFLVDTDGLIHRVYDAEQYPHLPNPIAVTRAIIKLAETLKPTPLTASDWILGSPTAPVTLIEYSDYQCGHCIELHHILEKILRAFPGQVAIAHRHLPLAYSHPLAPKAAEAAEAAGAQGKFWEMHHRLFAARGALERDQLIAYARDLRLNVEQFTSDLDTGRFQSAVREDFQLAVRNKIKLPPTLFVNGILWDRPRTEQELGAAIERLIACQMSCGKNDRAIG